jgi:hypothetical protein
MAEDNYERRLREERELKESVRRKQLERESEKAIKEREKPKPPDTGRPESRRQDEK